MDIEAPPRAQYIRTILFELSRIANVGLFLGDLGVQLGAVTPVFFAFRDREYVLNLIEGATGGRFHPNFDRIGGLKDDLPKGWIADTKASMDKIRDFCDEMETLVEGNEIFQARTRGIGVIPADVALAYGSNIRTIHYLDNCPTLLTGGGANLKLGQHLVLPKDTPLCNVWLTMLNGIVFFGHQVGSFFGGWGGPGLPGPLWFLIKVFIALFIFIKQKFGELVITLRSKPPENMPGVAAIVAHPARFAGRTVAAIVTGSNAGPTA